MSLSNIVYAAGKCTKMGEDYDYETVITETAKDHKFSADILYRMVFVLSNFNNCASGGLLRLDRKVAKSYCKIKNVNELYDVATNLNCGLMIVKGRTSSYFNGNMVLRCTIIKIRCEKYQKIF
jgi:hypothetical protein